MSNFPPVDLCFELPAIPSADKVCMPGGLCLSYIWDAIGKIPSLSDINMSFFAQIGPAMAPLKPIFDILDTVLALFRCVQAIPDAITSLDPSGLLECAPELAKAVDQLLKLIPQLSIPKMVKSILHNLATLLRAIGADLLYLESQLRRIVDAVQRAAALNDHTLNGFLVCAQNTVNDTALSTAEALRGIGSIILLVNIVMGLFGGPEVPCFGAIIGDNLAQGFDVVVDLLTTMAEVLDSIADAIPDPDLVLTLALGEQQC